MKSPLFALLALIAWPFLIQAQKVEWNGHTYEVIWFPQERLDPNRFPNGFTATGRSLEAPELAPDKLGGHLLTITSQREYDVVLGVWAEALSDSRATSRAPLGLSPSGDEFNVEFENYQWITGEAYSFRGMLAEPLHEYCEVFMGGDESRMYAGGAICRDTNYHFYILEKDPIDSDKDGVSDAIEEREGTNPNDPASVPMVTVDIQPAVDIQTATERGKSYQVQVSSDLKAWKNVSGKPTTSSRGERLGVS